jgi:hypothetical protein
MTMRRLAMRIVSAGGWLANALNQLPDGFRGDSHVRPLLVSWFIASFGLAAVVFFPLTPIAPRRHDLLVDSLALMISVGFGSAALLTAAGLLAGYVPFVPIADDGHDISEAAGIHPPEKLELFVTGVLDERGKRRRYRSRPATLSYFGADAIRVQIRTWLWWWGRHGLARHGGSPLMYRYVLSAEFGIGDLVPATPGTAYLVGSEKPAIHCGSKHGPLILAFSNARERDDVLAFLRGRS